MTGNNPTDRSKIGTKRHLLTDKNGIPLSTVITSASTHDIKAVADVIDNSVINRPSNLSFTKKNKRIKYNHLCLDKAYNSKPIENEIIRRGYVPHIPYKRKRGQRKEEIAYQHKHQTIRNKRWVVERTNS
jgi:IS5 family transposase